MSQPTQRYKRTFAGSVGSGMKSVMGGDNRRYYVLEHKVSTQYHKAGESQKIIVDQIELGRDSRCQVRFDETFGTVSRRHAAIVKDGENWKLVQLSQTNSTYLNGRKIEKEWYLQSGDEIQLSTNGPKLGFIVPQGDKGLVKSIGMTARLNLFRQQALRPYKQAIATLACLFVLCSCGSGYYMYYLQQENKRLAQRVTEYNEERRAAEAQQDEELNRIRREKDSLRIALESTNSANTELKRRVSSMERRVEDFERRPAPSPSPGPSNDAINACKGDVYFIQTQKFVITLPNGESLSITYTNGQDSEMDNLFSNIAYTGTGFLASDGRFITARHVAEGWYFWYSGGAVNEGHKFLNQVANNGGRVVAHFIAISSSGKQLQFTSNQFKVNRSTDQQSNSEDGSIITLARLNHSDWAYINNVSGGNLKVNSEKSKSLERNTLLTILGFPLGLGANSNSINPMSSEAKTAHEGLQNDVIITTATTYERGNSGGPVFYTNAEGKLEVIGIVSAGAGRSTGFVVPISAIQ